MAVVNINDMSTGTSGAGCRIAGAAIMAAGGIFGFMLLIRSDTSYTKGKVDMLAQMLGGNGKQAHTAASQAAGHGVSLQVKDALGNNASQRVNVRLWLATSDYGAPDATGNTVAVTGGAVLQQVVANADYQLITDASGACAVGVTVAGAANRYVLAEIGGRVYSSGQITWSA